MKYLGVAAVAVWVLVVGWVGAGLLRGTPVPTASMAVPADLPPDPLARMLASGETSLAAVRHALVEGRQPELPLVALAPLPIAAVTAEAIAASTAAAARVRHLSMIYSGGRFRRAVIDGEYLAEGSRLKDGGRVVAIRDQSVVVIDDGVRSELHIVHPYADIAPRSDELVRAGAPR